jgi:hypothetical protein
MRQGDLFAAEPILPAGFAHGEDVISSDDEDAAVKRFEALPFTPVILDLPSQRAS